MTLVRSLAFNLYFWVLTAVLCISGTVVRFLAPERIMAVPMLWARLILGGLRVICGIRLKVLGEAYLPVSGPAIIASQHQSAFDIMVWLLLLPRCCYVIKKELTYIPLFGGMIRPAGMIVVDRQAGPAAMRHLMREADRAKREERQVVIFPEGTRAKPGEPLPLRPGVAAMAARTMLPVIPVLTDSGRCWGRRAFLKRPGVIHVAVLPAIPAGSSREQIMSGLEMAFRPRISQVIPPGVVDNSVSLTSAGLSGESNQAQ
jgi:1-acyl-sn-glycerol-3-phosphate acyltransferase